MHYVAMIAFILIGSVSLLTIIAVFQGNDNIETGCTLALAGLCGLAVSMLGLGYIGELVPVLNFINDVT